MHPAPSRFFAFPQEANALPDALRRALSGTIDAYNAGIYTAAAVSARRTLEGIFKYLMPADSKPQALYKMIELAASNNNLAAPLNALSHAIRAGGNLGAHFDAEREPDERIARQIVELVVYLVLYLYVLPSRIQDLEAALGKPIGELSSPG